MCETIEDEDTRAMLRAVEVAALRYLLTVKCGTTVAALREAGEQNVYYDTVWKAWQDLRELNYGEISRFKEQEGVSAIITGLETSDWNAYIGKMVEILDQYSAVDTETWLALLTAQQSSQALSVEKTTAVGVDRTGDGVEDFYRVTIAAPLKLVRDVSLSLDMQFEIEDEFEREMMAFMGVGETVSIGTVCGTPVQESLVSTVSQGWDLGSGVRELFEKENCAYDLATSVDHWYELLDGDGIGHVIAVGDVDLSSDQELKIPVKVRFVEPKEDGTDWEETGYLVYGDGQFKGYLKYNSTNPMISLSNSAFNGATIQTVAITPVNMLGVDLGFNRELSEPFTLPMESSRDRGMKLVMTPISEIGDLADEELTANAVVTDLYGYQYDISVAVQAAREEAASGNLIYSIEAAEITVPDAVFNRRLQQPQVTVTIGGVPLEQDVDYTLLAEPMLKAGTEEITLFGTGDYVGYTKANFTTLPADSTVEALEKVAADDLAEADVTVLTVDTAAHPENVQFDFSATDAARAGSLREGSDGKSVILEQGAEAGVYSIVVSVIGGAEDTYANIEPETFVIEVE